MKRVRLSDIADINVNSIGKDYPYQEIEYIDISSVGSGILLDTKVYQINKAPSRAKRLVICGDTILSTVRPNRRSFLYVKSPKDNWVVSTGFAVLHPKNGIDSRYLYYTVTHQKFTDYLTISAKGAAYPAVDTEIINRAECLLPSLSSQCKIASILSAYDDLIENNNRRIKILEQMAQTIYDEWFVKFRFPGHSKVKMVDSELGKIPEGWHTETVEKIVDFHIGGGWGKETMDDKHCVPAYVIRGTDIPLAKHLCIDNCPLRYHTESNLKKRRLEDNDIILEVSGGSYDQPVGRALILSKQLHSAFNEDVICASFCKRIKIKSDVLSPYIFLLHLETIYENRKIEKYQVQSTGIKNFKFDFFLKQDNLLIPNSELQKQFVSVIQPLMEQKDILGAKNSILSKSRDILLPKLISGEIDVEDMHIDVGDVD